MKICVITPRFSIAGVPLAQVRFARALASTGHQVDLVIGYVLPGLTAPECPGVNLITLGQPKVRGMLLPVWRYLRSAKPDVIFSAEDHLNAMVMLAAILARSKAKISGSCRVTPFDTYSNNPFTMRWILKQVTRALMWRADALTCVSRDMVDQYRKVFRDPRHTHVYTWWSAPAPWKGCGSRSRINGLPKRASPSSLAPGAWYRGKAWET